MLKLASLLPRLPPGHRHRSGPKLRTYRATAERVMQRVLPAVPGSGPLADSRNTPSPCPGSFGPEAADHPVARV
jgi:glycerol-3-phosphate dehydrogenase